MALHHPNPNITQLNTLTPKTITLQRENLADRLHHVMLQEETRKASLAQLHHASETALPADISSTKIAYKHRHIAQGKGYELRAKRQPTLAHHLQEKCEELDPKTQRIERQWVFALSQGLLETQPPRQLIENLLMRKLQQGNPTFLQISKDFFELSLWLKRLTVAHQQTWEGQRLGDVINQLQFRETKLTD